MPLSDDCVFCFESAEVGSNGVGPERILDSYDHWWVVLQPERKRNKTKPAAGLLVVKRHIERVSLVNPDEAAELFDVVKEAARTMCEAVGMTYTGQETVGYNEGAESGQTQMHAHVHVLPVAQEYPDWLKGRAGMGKAFSALNSSLQAAPDRHPVL